MAHVTFEEDSDKTEVNQAAKRSLRNGTGRRDV